MSEERAGALELLAAGRFDQWTGLPPRLSVSDVTAIFPASDLAGPGRLGADRVPARYVTAVVPGFGRDARVWFVPPDDHVVLMDVTHAAVGLDAMRRQLGEPEFRLDSFLDVVRLAEGELVYPSRGLTLFTNPANQLLLRIALYESTTFDDYQRRLRLDLEPRDREWPADWIDHE